MGRGSGESRGGIGRVSGESVPAELLREREAVASCHVKVGDRIIVRAQIQGERERDSERDRDR